VKPRSVEYTAFATSYGDFQYKLMPFGLCDALAIFQRFISNILFKNWKQNCAVYLDDILITTLDIPNHIKTLKSVLTALTSENVIGNRKKSLFLKKGKRISWYEIDSSGIKPLKKLINDLLILKTPNTKMEEEKMLGSLNYIQKFIRDTGNLFHLVTKYKMI
jgi:Reverse transcriptase (RNA-dependent DNA polymerase)